MSARIALVTDTLHFVGLPTARALVEDGFRVFCHDVSFAPPGTRNTFNAENVGMTALAAQTPEAMVGEVMAAAGALDALILNDAYPAIRGPIDEASGDDLRATYEALVFRGYELAGQAVPQMKAKGRGHIVFVSSAAPLRGLANYSVYVSARGAANALARSLAIELAPFGIIVNALAPNYVESPTYFPPALMAKPEAAAKILRNIPLGRLGRPEEAAKTIAFLVSGDADFLTGQIIPFAGGWA